MLDGDRFIADQIQPRLAANEAIVHTAYLETASGTDIMDGRRERAYWAALTPQRLLLIETGVGAFKPLLENKGVEVIERANIAGVHAQGGTLTIALTDGRRFAFLAGRSPKHASGQAELIDELVARHGRGPVAAPIAKSVNLKRRTAIAMAVITLGIAAIQHCYGKRAEVSVECTVGSEDLQCTATHISGGAKAYACWNVEISCQNGKKAVASACAQVQRRTSSTVTVAEQDFKGREACDEPTGIEVTNLKLE